MKTLKWFENRIGKRIYRDDNVCGCKTCRDVTQHGIIVNDRDHAEYLFDCQNDYRADGILLNYRDIQ